MDWSRWHDDYSDPTSRLSQRLAVVERAISAWLNAQPNGPQRLVSACAGQGRDVVGALHQHPRRGDVTGLLVEFDPTLADQARLALASTGLDGLEVLTGDAGNTSAYAGWIPTDLVLVCGVFGNVTDEDVLRIVEALPSLCAEAGTVIWTRHREAPDLTPEIRAWFGESGFEEVAFTSSGPGGFGVGVNRLSRRPDPFTSDQHLFTFTR